MSRASHQRRKHKVNRSSRHRLPVKSYVEALYDYEASAVLSVWVGINEVAPVAVLYETAEGLAWRTAAMAQGSGQASPDEAILTLRDFLGDMVVAGPIVRDAGSEVDLVIQERTAAMARWSMSTESRTFLAALRKELGDAWECA